MTKFTKEYLKKIKESLRYGDLKRIADLTGRSRNIISQTLKGRIKNMKICIVAERIAEKNEQELEDFKESIQNI